MIPMKVNSDFPRAIRKMHPGVDFAKDVIITEDAPARRGNHRCNSAADRMGCGPCRPCTPA
jgi:hypothetical protein